MNTRCNDAAFAVDHLMRHIHDLHHSLFLSMKNVPTPQLISSQILSDVVTSFVEKTHEEPLFKENPEQLLQFVKFKIARKDNTLILISQIRLPLKLKTFQLFEFFPAINLIDNHFCSLDEMNDIIFREDHYFSSLSPKQARSCEVFDMLTLCSRETILTAPEENSCTNIVLQNSTTDLMLAKNCQTKCFDSAFNQVIILYFLIHHDQLFLPGF